MAVKPIPEGYHAVTPYLLASDAAGLLDFMQRALGAVERHRMAGPGGRVMHAEVQIGDSRVMLGEPPPGKPLMPANLYLYVPDCDAMYQRAVAAGGTSIQAPATMPYGDRHGAVRDPAGNVWWIATHVEDVSMEEIAERMKKYKP